jgi:hypothetical protein
MDRLQFIGSIDHGNFVTSPDTIIQFFDHTMAAYDLIGQCNDDIDVKSTIESSLCMNFTISFISSDQALRMVDKIMNYFHNRIELYGKRFLITPNANGNIVGIQILQT